MQDWKRLVGQWERSVREILLGLPADSLTDTEQKVIETGLIIPRTQVTREDAVLLTEAMGLSPEADYIDFLEHVGAIHLVAMGADDGILFGAAELKLLGDRSQSFYAALLDGVSVTSMKDYLNTEYVSEPLVMLPIEILERTVAISTPAGSKIFAAARISTGNDYLRLSLHGTSIRYSSFEEFIVMERDYMLESLRESIEERAEQTL